MTQPSVAHRPALAHHPLAILAVSFVAGIVIARFCLSSLAAFLSCGAVCSLLVIYFYAKRKQGIATVMLALALLCMGAALAVIEKRSVGQNRVQRFYDSGLIASGQPLEVTGALDSPPEFAPDGFYLSLSVEQLRIRDDAGQNASGVVWLFVPVRDAGIAAEYDALELRYGARVRVMTALRRAENFRNPGVSSFTEYLEQRGFDATGTIKSPLLVERLDDARVFLPLAWLYEWRERLLGFDEPEILA